MVRRYYRMPPIPTRPSRRMTRVDRAALYVDRQFDRVRLPRFGWRNVFYLGFVLCCAIYGVTLQVLVLPPDMVRARAGLILGVTYWAAGTLPFFLWNMVSLAVALTRDQPASRPAVSVTLSVATLALGWPLLTILDHLVVHLQ